VCVVNKIAKPLTERQGNVLKSTVKEYLKTSRPVSSGRIFKRYHFHCSPATIRNEMSELIEKGMLLQPHTSAGRLPTKKALKFFVDETLNFEDDVVSKKEKVILYEFLKSMSVIEEFFSQIETLIPKIEEIEFEEIGKLDNKMERVLINLIGRKKMLYAKNINLINYIKEIFE